MTYKVSVTRSTFKPTEHTGHAAAPAGVPVSVGSAEPTLAMDSDPVPPPTPARVPFYKRKWFIIAQIITAPIGFAMIFILLWPVVRAVVQLIVNKATLDIQVATISDPTNSS